MASNSENLQILLVDSDEAARNSLADSLTKAGHHCHQITDGTAALERCLAPEGEVLDCIVTEIRLEGIGGLELISRLKDRRPRLPVIALSNQSDGTKAIAAVQAGAFDFLSKPIDTEEVFAAIEDAVAASRRMSKPVSMGDNHVGEDDTLVGKSRAMTRVFRDVARISATPVTVLIRGETGTGKELVARAIYQHGHRAHRPFIAVNCAAIPEQLLESELFGHEKGAFTGAHSMRVGRFEQAHNATLFLDEIGDMDLMLQAKLLRVLQEKQIQRIGGREDLPVDARIIAATHQDLEEMVAEGSFRADLFYRLNVASVEIPPLRERREDIPLLIEHFASRFASEIGQGPASLTAEAISFLEAQPWHGNVRQLQNILKKALVEAGTYAVDSDLVERLVSTSLLRPNRSPGDQMRSLALEILQKAESGEVADAYAVMLAQMEQCLLSEAMNLSKGNQARAARWLGISRLTLREKLKQYGLHPKS